MIEQMEKNYVELFADLTPCNTYRHETIFQMN